MSPRAQELIEKRMAEVKAMEENADAKVAAAFENMKRRDDETLRKIQSSFEADIMSAGKRFFKGVL